MNINHLKCFQSVYEEQSINRAARRLFISPQGLSKNIRILEEELGTTLFTRTKQGVTPTDSAHFLYARAETIIRQIEEVAQGVRQLENRKILLRLGCACGVFNVLPLKLILRFMEENAHIDVTWCEYTNAEVRQLLETSQIEYGFTVGASHALGLVERHLAGRDVLLLIYGEHPLYDQDIIDIDSIRGENIIIMNEHFHIYQDFVNACRARDFMPNIVAKTADGALLYKLCRQRIGLAVIPEFMLEDFRLEGMRAIPFREALRWDVYGVYREDNKNFETIRRLDDFLKANM